MSVATVAVMASNAFAQAKPNFAGTWNQVVDTAAMAAAAGGGGGGGGRGGGRGGGGGGACGGATFTVAQDAATLTCTRTTPNGEVKAVYNLDGSDSKNMVNGRGGQTEQVSKVTWEGSNMAITRTQDMQGTAVTIKQVWTLDPSGTLWIENFRDGTAMGMKQQYKKGIPVKKEGN
jgi:hypothetical protein